MFTTYDLRDFIEGIAKIFAIGYWGSLLLFLAVLVPLAYKQPQKRTNKILLASMVAMGVLWLFLWFIPKQLGPSKEEIQAQQEWNRKYQEAEAVFNEQCKKAGEKIYRTADNVEGIMLLKIPQEDIFSHGSDPTWQDAALGAVNGKKSSFINMFLQYKAIPNDGNSIIKFTNEEKIYENHTYYKGYNFVDIKKNTGQVIRYNRILENNDLLDNVESNIHPEKPARYAVTYETEVYPNYWIAGAKIIILDNQTDEIIAEKNWYIFDRGLGSKSGARTPWLYADTCGHLNASQSEIRLFVDKVLQPKQETQNVK